MNRISPDQIHGHVIGYSQETYDKVEAPFTALDNRANPRPDWQEYWPIRHHLLNTPMQEDHLYGFLSPRFREKTGLSPAQIVEYLCKQPSDTDVVLFSPQPDMGAFFLNVFDQNEVFDPGFKESAQSFCQFAGIDIDLSQLVMDSRNIVFSNYFFAKPAFWRRWLSVCEVLFSACENNPRIADIHGWLKQTNYRDRIQRKVFLLERIASLIIKLENHWRVESANTFEFAYSASRLNQFPETAVICDALKISFQATNNDIYIKKFSAVISSISKALEDKQSAEINIAIK